MSRIALFAAGLFIFGCQLGTGCTPAEVAPNIENAAAVAQYEALLDDCRKQGKEAGSYAAYSICADKVDDDLCREAHLRCKDGGAR